MAAQRWSEWVSGQPSLSVNLSRLLDWTRYFGANMRHGVLTPAAMLAASIRRLVGGQAVHACRPGQSVVEVAFMMAIIIPVFLGTFDLGRAYFGYGELVHAVNEGARRGSFDSDTATIIATVLAAGAHLSITSEDVIVTCYSGATATTKVCSTIELGDTISVAAQARYTPATPWVTHLIPGGILTLRAASQRTFQ